MASCPIHPGCHAYVPWNGPETARLAVIGEGPGAQEFQTGRPFVGPAGHVLDTELARVGIPRSEVFAYNAVPCFGNTIPRTPTEKDLKVWRQHLLDKLIEVKPEVILAVGGWATGAIIGKRRITTEQGAERRVRLAPDYEPWVMPCFHPAATLHDPNKKPDFIKTITRTEQLLNGKIVEWYAGYKIVDDTTIAEAVSDLSDTVLSVDIESAKSEVVVVGLGNPGRPIWVFPVGHPEVDPAVQARLRAAVRGIFDATMRDGIRVMHNGKYDTQALKAEGLMSMADRGVDWDGVLVGHLLDETRADKGRLKLKVLGQELFGIQRYWTVPISTMHTVQQGKKTVTKLVEVPLDAMLRTGRAREVPLETLAEYNARDVALTLMVKDAFDKDFLADQKLVRLYQKLVLPAYHAMEPIERAGLPTDMPTLQKLEVDYATDLAGIDAELNQMFSGEVSNWNSDAQLRKLLFDKLGLPVVRRTTIENEPSVDVSSLMLLKGNHPVIDLLLRRSEADKRVTTVQTLKDHIAPDGRIHPTFVVAGPSTGRTSSRDPNVQNIPRGKGIRDIIRARPGYKLVELDFSLIELRWGAHVYNEPKLKSLLQQGKDLHRYTASLAYGKPMDAISSSERTHGKTANFLLLYGGGPDKLSTHLRDNGVTELEAQQALVAMGQMANSEDPIYFLALALWKAFHRAYPALKPAHEMITREIRRNKTVRTLFGRVRRLPGIDSANRKEAIHAALSGINTLVQGPASDTMLLALPGLVEMAPKYGALIVDVVHDAVLAEVPEDQVIPFAKHAKQILETPDFAQFDVTFDIPILVDAKVGHSWGSLKDLREESEVPQTYEVQGPTATPDPKVLPEAPVEVEQALEPFAAALAYQARGWSVIQLTAPGQGFQAGGKAPAINWEPYQHRHATIQEIQAWFGKRGDGGNAVPHSKNGKHNIGIVTGSVSKLVVIDIDPKKGGLDWLKEKNLTSPATVRTGGDGLHLYFHYEGPPLTNRAGMAPGVDIRAEGGQVAAPPSLHQSGKRYVWLTPDGLLPAELPELPVWLAEEIKTRANVQAVPISGEGRNIPPARIDEVVDQLLPYYVEGRRHDMQLALAGFLAKRNYQMADVEDLVIRLANAAEDTGELNDRLMVVRDTYRKVTVGETVAGSDKLRDYLPADALDRLLELFGSLRKVGVIEVMHGPDFVAKKREEVSWLIDKLLPTAGIWMMSGHPGAGKTTLALQFAFSLAAGMDLWGLYAVPKAVKVLYLQADNPPHMFEDLVRRLSQRMPGALANMYFSNVTKSIKVNTEQGYETMRQLVELYTPDMILLDTIRDFHSANENDPTAVAETLDALKSIRGNRSISVGFIHHHSKGSATERMQIEKHMGSMRFVTPVDLSMSLTFDEKEMGYVILRFTKIRWAAGQQPVTLQRRDNWYEHVGGGV